jgi:hypothetical protein
MGVAYISSVGFSSGGPMHTHYSEAFSNIVLTMEQKRQIDDVIVQFSQKLISIPEMCSRIQSIKSGGSANNDDDIFSYIHIPCSMEELATGVLPHH